MFEKIEALDNKIDHLIKASKIFRYLRYDVH